MVIKSETSLFDFKFWSGAVDRAEKLCKDDFDKIEDALSDMYPDGMTECEVNDFFWFEEDFLAQCIGYDSWDEFLDSIDEEEEEK